MSAKKSTAKKSGKAAEAAGAIQPITRDTMVGDAAQMSPDAPEIMFSYGLHCFGCGMNAFETIEQGCMGHGMGDDEIDNLVKELNEAVERSRALGQKGKPAAGSKSG